MSLSVPAIVVHDSLDTSRHVSLFTNFLQTTTTPHRHRIAFHRLHAENHNTKPSPYHASPTSRRQPHAASWFCAALITYHHPYYTHLKLLVPTHCRRDFDMLHQPWTQLDVPQRRRRGGKCQQLQAMGTELKTEPARVSRLASGYSSRQLFPCRRRTCNNIALRHKRTYGTMFGGCGHCPKR